MSKPINGSGTSNGNTKRSFKLMIVDDSNIMRRRIERSQQFEELQLVGTAGDGVEALDLFRRTDPDVVTMDITMPHMDGIECIARLVAMKPAIRILVVSALADKATVARFSQTVEGQRVGAIFLHEYSGGYTAGGADTARTCVVCVYGRWWSFRYWSMRSGIMGSLLA